MDLEQYIIAKFCEFKFSLIEETEKEVDLFKNKLISMGRLYSGQTILALYEIRLKSLSKMIDRYLEIEIETRKEKKVEFNDDVFTKIENNLINFIEHEFDNLIHKMREEANLIGFGKDDYENKFKVKIISDKDSLVSNLKRKLEMQKFESSNNKSNLKILEDYQDTAEVCLNGHVINPNIKRIPNLRKPFCGECGKKTIIECPYCKKPVPGRFIYKDFEDKTVWGPPSKFCDHCGNPYPWAEKLANEFLDNTEIQNFDAFLSHADDDKESIADELFRRLKNDGFKIWYDEKIRADQSIPKEINEGISKSKNGIVIFSDYYHKKPWCMDELNALKYKSNSCKNFKIFIILHNFSLDVFKTDYPIYSHKRILSSKEGFAKILSEIEPQLSIKIIEDYKEEIEDIRKYIKMSTNAIIDYYNFNPEKNHSMKNHSKKIILENLKDIPLTITKIVIKTDFPVVQNFFNSDAKIKLNEKEYKFDSTGEIEIWLNQNPLILSPKANISLILSLNISTKVTYKNEYNFQYSIDINEFSGKSEGSFEIKTAIVEN